MCDECVLCVVLGTMHEQQQWNFLSDVNVLRISLIMTRQVSKRASDRVDRQTSCELLEVVLFRDIGVGRIRANKEEKRKGRFPDRKTKVIMAVFSVRKKCWQNKVIRNIIIVHNTMLYVYGKLSSVRLNVAFCRKWFCLLIQRYHTGAGCSFFSLPVVWLQVKPETKTIERKMNREKSKKNLEKPKPKPRHTKFSLFFFRLFFQESWTEQF